MPCKSGKAKFYDEGSALWNIEFQNGNRLRRGLTPIPLYVYTCRNCDGLHLTKRRQELPSVKARSIQQTQEMIDTHDWMAEVSGGR